MATNAKKAAASETHQSIARQTAEFLKAGNKIQRIPSGVTGMQGNLSGYKKTSKSK